MPRVSDTSRGFKLAGHELAERAAYHGCPGCGAYRGGGRAARYQRADAAAPTRAGAVRPATMRAAAAAPTGGGALQGVPPTWAVVAVVVRQLAPHHQLLQEALNRALGGWEGARDSCTVQRPAQCSRAARVAPAGHVQTAVPQPRRNDQMPDKDSKQHSRTRPGLRPYCFPVAGCNWTLNTGYWILDA